MSADELWAARVDDPLLHTSFWADLVSTGLEALAYVAVGAAACAVVGVAACTGPGAIVAAVACAAVAASIGDKISAGCDAIGDALFPPDIAAYISTGSEDTHTNSKKSARAAGTLTVRKGEPTEEIPSEQQPPQEEPSLVSKLWEGTKNFASEFINPTVASPAAGAIERDKDLINCTKHTPETWLAEGSEEVYINNQPAVRADDRSTCEAKVCKEVSPDVRIGGKSVIIRPIHSGKSQLIRIAGTLISLARLNPRSLLKNLPCLLIQTAVTSGAAYTTQALIRGANATSNPVNAATGAKILGNEDDLDFSLTGILPIEWQRFYNSRDLRTNTLFGTGWSVPYEIQVELIYNKEQAKTIWVYTDEQGRRIELGEINLGNIFFSAADGLTVRYLQENILVINDTTGLYRFFETDPLNKQRMRLTKLVDRNDNVLEVTYNDQGLLEHIRDPDQLLGITLAYDKKYPQRVSHIYRVNEEDKEQPQIELLTSYHYNGAGLLSEVIDSMGVTYRHFTYDKGQRLTSHTLTTGNTCYYEWALFDTPKKNNPHADKIVLDKPQSLLPPSSQEWRVVKHWTDSGDEYLLDYDLTKQQMSVTDSLGRKSYRKWDENYNITEFTENDGAVHQFIWEKEQLIKYIDPENNTWTNSYDVLGNLVESKDPLGRSTLTEWLDNWELPLKETNEEGKVWQYRYDPKGNLITEIDPLEQITRYHYDHFGRVIKITDPAGKDKHLRWDRHSQLIQYKDCSGSDTFYQYDKRGYLASITDSLNNTSRFNHDNRGFLLSSELPDGRIQKYQRDAIGQLTAYIDPANKQISYRYDNNGRVINRIDANGHQVRFIYDDYGRLVSLTNENNESYSFQWDIRDRLIQQTELNGSARKYHYNKVDDITQVEYLPAPLNTKNNSLKNSATQDHDQTSQIIPLADDSQPIKHIFQRDAVGRLIKKITTDGITEYDYDKLDQLTQITFIDPTRKKQTIQFNYDDLGQLIQEINQAGTINYSYDELGNCIQTQLPDGRSINRLYYGNGHLHQINLDGLVISDFERDKLHREIFRTQGKLSTRRSYDKTGRLARLERRHQSLAKELPAELEKNYQYDASDNLIQIKTINQTHHQGQRSQIEQIANFLNYDSVGNIQQSYENTQSQRGLNYQQLSYDRAANLISSNQGQGYVKYNQIRVYQDKRYDYDRYGRLATKQISSHTTQQFKYDAEHRLIEIKQTERGQTTYIRFKYDALGRRTEKATYLTADHQPITKTTFQWEGMQLLGENQNNLTSLYIYNDESYEPLVRIDGDTGKEQINYFHTNIAGLPEQLTDQQGNNLWQADYEIWGNNKEEWHNNQTNFKQNLRYQGQYLDRETGLHYNTFRYYDPDIGRFTQPDPIGLAGGFNLYQYAPNPITWIDPLGLCPKAFRSSRSSTKGEWGKARGANYLESKGYRVVGKEVTMTVNGKIIRADLVGYNPTTKRFLVVETKAGPSAKLTRNQRASGVFSTNQSTVGGSGTLRGKNAQNMINEATRVNGGVTPPGLSGSTMNTDFTMKHYRFPGGVNKPR